MKLIQKTTKISFFFVTLHQGKFYAIKHVFYEI